MKVVRHVDGGTELRPRFRPQYGNKEQYVSLPATTKRVIAWQACALARVSRHGPSDIRLPPCDADGNAITSYGGDEGGGNNDAVRPVVLTRRLLSRIGAPDLVATPCHRPAALRRARQACGLRPQHPHLHGPPATTHATTNFLQRLRAVEPPSASTA